MTFRDRGGESKSEIHFQANTKILPVLTRCGRIMEYTK